MINNDIKESYCSFKVAKLLKELGYLVNPDTKFYDKDGKFSHCQIYSHTWKQLRDGKGTDVICPTQSLALNWIQSNFGTRLWVNPKKISRDYFIEMDEKILIYLSLIKRQKQQ